MARRRVEFSGNVQALRSAVETAGYVLKPAVINQTLGNAENNFYLIVQDRPFVVVQIVRVRGYESWEYPTWKTMKPIIEPLNQ